MKCIFMFFFLFSLTLKAGGNIPFLEEGRSASSIVLEGWSSLPPCEDNPAEYFLVGMLDFAISQSFGSRQVYTVDLDQGRFQYVFFSSGFKGMIVESYMDLGLKIRGVCYLYLQFNETSEDWKLNHYLCHKESKEE